MSQDEPSRSRRRESILKQRQVVEVEEEQVVVGGKNKRRVSFRNVKEVQFFNRDKNCPELLHDAAPIREKINETLGSDGIMSPGRSVHSHSSKNNTLDMFGDGARKPVPTVPQQEVQKFVVTENRMNGTSYSCVDMSIADETQDGDSTLQMFNKTTANTSMNGDGLNETMAAFQPARNAADITMQMFTKKAVATAPREQSPVDPEPVAMDISIANNSANDTMLAFRSAKAASISPPLNETMDMFQNPQKSGQQHHVDVLNKTSHSPTPMEISMDATQPRRVHDAGANEMNITMEMFTKSSAGATGQQKTPKGKELEEKRPTPRLHLSPVVNKDLDDTFALFGGAKKTNDSIRQEPVGDLNNTFAMFAGAQQKPEEPSKPATPAAVGHNATMSLLQEKKTANATMALFDENIIKNSAQKKNNETMALFEEKKAAPAKYDETLVLFKETKEVVIEETNNDTFNLFSGANQNVGREPAGNDANGTMTIFSNGQENQTMNQSDMDISTATALGMDNTHLIFTAAGASDSSSQERELEEERKMDVSIVNSAGIAPSAVANQERLTEHKTPEAVMVHNVSDMEMDITSATIANVSTTSSANGERTLRASILSQSLRSRRRSSLGSTIREMSFNQNSPSLRADPNTSLQEQLSFIYRNTLFDAKTTRIAYLEPVEGQTEANKLRAVAAKKLNDMVEEKIAVLGEEKKRALREVSDKCPEKFTAVENLNPRLLSPLDRDIMNASLARAEEQWWEVRKQFATQFTKEVKEQRLAIGKELKKAQEDALLCEEVDDLESKYAMLEKEMNELDEFNMEELEKLDEEETKLQRMIEEQELKRYEEKNEKLRRELEFVLQEIEDKKAIAKFIQAEIAEREAKKQAVLAALNEPSGAGNESQ